MAEPRILKTVIYLKSNGKSHFWFTHQNAQQKDTVTFRSTLLNKTWNGEVTKIKDNRARVDGKFERGADVAPIDGDLETVTITITNQGSGENSNTPDILIVIDDG